MSFFDTLKQQVLEVGQTTAQKTRDIADTVKLNSAISDEEKKIKIAKEAIGQLYVDLYFNNPGEQFVSHIQEIKNAQSKIEELKSELSKLKGVKYCESCGKEVSTSAAFCPSCGKEVKKEETVVQTAVEEVKDTVSEVVKEAKDTVKDIQNDIQQ